MKLLREYIRKEIRRLSEDNLKFYKVPLEIRNALENNLKLKPLIRYVSTLKASATVPPSYRVFFQNNQHIDLYIEQIGIKAVINNKSFWLQDIREANAAIQELNRVLTQPIPVTGEEGEEGEEGGEGEDMEPEAGGEEEGGEEEQPTD
jgi:hypothetical protein